MPDTFDANGLQIKSLTELTDELTLDLQTIYGTDINVDSNSPDGQVVGIVAQEGIDLRELLQNINSGFDPDQAEGVTLDQRLSPFGIKRGIGTFTTVSIDVTVTKSLSLVGLDSEAGMLNPQVVNLYTVKDDAGNQWYLLASQSPASAGTYSYTFQAADIGAVQVTANTITTPVTIVDGVSTVNNPGVALEQGTNEETDAELRTRFHKATLIKATGYSDALESALQNLSGVKSATVYENRTDTTDGSGTPPHSVWAIVDGGANADIAQTLFQKRSLGCDMRGAVTYDILRSNGQIFTAQWDTPTLTPIYVKFTIALPGGTVSPTALAEAIVGGVQWQVGVDAIGSTITAFLVGLNSAYRVTGMGLSTDGVTYTETLTVADASTLFVMDVSRFDIT